MFRKMEEKDLDTILGIENEVFHGRWNKNHFLYELNENEFANLYVLEIEDKIVGYFDLWITFETAQISTIAVKKDAQSKGYGSILMNEMISLANKNLCETLMLEVRVSNTIAIHLYEKYGFIKMNIRKGYYNDNQEDAIVMAKALGGGYCE